MIPHGPTIESGLRLAEGAREEIQKLLKKLNIEAEIAIESGVVTPEADRRAMQFGANLLVIGRHAAKGPEGWLHPHAYAFIRESPCPVVSI
jgi:nucleotide-binding universal stress UspA family protein